MEPIKSIAILGMGALGCAYASKLIDSGAFEVSAIARGERYERLEANGFVANGKTYSINVIHPDADPKPADFLIVAVKQHHLQAALPDLRVMVGDHTTIISVMNGLDSEEMIGKLYGMDKVLYAISVGIDALRQGSANAVTFTTTGKIIFGHAKNDTHSPMVQRVVDALDKANLGYDVPVDMLYMLWWKFMVNVGVNQSSAVMRAPYGMFQSFPEAQALMEAAMHEVITLAQAEGVSLHADDIQKWYAFLNTLSPDGETSMLQDVKAGRKTEVELFGGKVMELGRTHNIPTPVNDTLVRIIHALEKQYLG